MFCDEAVASIADSTRNDPKERDPRPGRTQPSKDSENRVGLQVDRVVLDQNNAGQFASTSNMVFNYRLTSRRLLRGEAKSAVRIALYHESDPAVAEIANPVEQDNRRLLCDCHQLPTKTLLHSADVVVGDDPLPPDSQRKSPLAITNRAHTSALLTSRIDLPKHARWPEHSWNREAWRPAQPSVVPDEL